MPRPIVVGQYVPFGGGVGGPVTYPRWGQSWPSEHAEVRPDTIVNTADPGDGSTLTAAQLSTFKVVRTSSHFECLGYLDALNAYDDVTVSLGPCHWTLAISSGGNPRDQARELPATMAHYRQQAAADYAIFFERFGMIPHDAWPIAPAGAAYNTSLDIQTETSVVNLSGVSGTQAYGREENKYCRTWQSYYRFQMACRTSQTFRESMWDLTRLRIQNILDRNVNTLLGARRVGDFITSEKAVAMILRWHIWRPGHVFTDIANAFNTVLPNAYPNDTAREAALMTALISEADNRYGAGNNLSAAMRAIQGWTNVPQTGTRAWYSLNLANPAMSGAANSFDFAAP